MSKKTKEIKVEWQILKDIENDYLDDSIIFGGQLRVKYKDDSFVKDFRIKVNDIYNYTKQNAINWYSHQPWWKRLFNKVRVNEKDIKKGD